MMRPWPARYRSESRMRSEVMSTSNCAFAIRIESSSFPCEVVLSKSWVRLLSWQSLSASFWRIVW